MLTHASADGCEGGCPLWAIVNDVGVMNRGVLVSAQVPALSYFLYTPSSGIAGSHGDPMLNFM